MTYILLFALTLFLAGFLWLRFRAGQLAGEDLSQYDSTPAPFASAAPSEGLDTLNAHINQVFIESTKPAAVKAGWTGKRERFDAIALARDFGDVEFRPDTLTIDGQDITGSWTLVPGYDPDKRLVYFHGGAFTLGSDISHRPITVQLARLTGMAVFAPNYRLMPENSRREGISDVKAVYEWIIENGPDGAAPSAKFVLAGDSAGGNLVLMLANWARKQASRQADAVIALSPMTDSTFSSPSLKSNMATDHMLRPMLKPILKLPKLIMLPAIQHHYAMSPSDPEHSPIYDELSGLPPIFIQASQDEQLRDDAIRFANKAKAAGSPVNLQIWGGGLPHVWQMFDNYIPEAGDALKEIKVFLDKYA